MGDIQDISKQPLIEWGGQVVITTAQLAQAYGTTTKNVSNNFNRNEGRFEIGKHYFVLQGAELKDFMRVSSERGQALSPSTSIVYLWTRRGASRHCKILGTDKAWEQFDYLEEYYFDRQEQKQQTPPFTLQQQIQTIAKGTDELYEKVGTLEQRFNKFEDELPVTGADMDSIQTAVRKKGTEALGGKGSGAYRDNSIRMYVYADIQCELRRQFGVKKYKEIRHKDTPDALKIVEGYELPLALKSRVDMANAQQSFSLEGGISEC